MDLPKRRSGVFPVSNDNLQGLSVEAQLAVLNTKLDSLIAYNKQRGEDHEARIRVLEQVDYVTQEDYDARFKRIATVLSLVCIIITAAVNTTTFLIMR